MVDYLMVGLLVVLAGAVIALLMILRDRLLTARREKMIDQITCNVINGYLPAATEDVTACTVNLMDELINKVPDWMDKINKTLKEMNKIEN